MASTKPTILVQLDTDPQPSVFDGVVAVDAGVDHLFRHGGVRPESVRDLVYGALFTRGTADLGRTALFIGGSDVAAGEAVLKEVQKTFFAGFRVSVLAMPCDPRWRTPEGLKVVGPGYFGYDTPYVPIEQRVGGAA